MGMASLTPDQTDALAALDGAAALYRETERRHVEAREALHKQIVRALKSGVGSSETARHAPYDRNHVDRIRRNAGIPSKR